VLAFDVLIDSLLRTNIIDLQFGKVRSHNRSNADLAVQLCLRKDVRVDNLSETTTPLPHLFERSVQGMEHTSIEGSAREPREVRPAFTPRVAVPKFYRVLAEILALFGGEAQHLE